MKEGLVGVRLDAGATRGVIAEINCESDFVARTDDFQALVETVTTRPAGRGRSRIGLAHRARGRGWPEGRPPRSPSSARTWRCRVRRASAATRSGRQLHPPGRQDRRPRRAGRGRRTVSADPRRRSRCCERSRCRSRPPAPAFATRTDVPADVIEQEKSVYRAQMENSGKPANVIEKIVEGKLGSFYAQAVLPEQPSIRDPKTTVAQVLADASTVARGPGLGDAVRPLQGRRRQ